MKKNELMIRNYYEARKNCFYYASLSIINNKFQNLTYNIVYSKGIYYLQLHNSNRYTFVYREFKTKQKLMAFLGNIPKIAFVQSNIKF